MIIKYRDGTELPAIPRGDDECECGVSREECHLPGCDMERCPRCNGQLISCDCLLEEGDEGQGGGRRVKKCSGWIEVEGW